MNTAQVDNSKKEPLSLLNLELYVLEQLKWNFIGFPQKTIAIDGIFEIFNSNNHKTGEHIWVEVKTGSSYLTNLKDTTSLTLNFSDKEKFKQWKRIWNTVPGAMVMIYVDYENNETKYPIFYWVDLKKSESYVADKEGQIRIPINQTIERNFFTHCKSLIDFKSSTTYLGNLPTVLMDLRAFDYIKLTGCLKQNARQQYRIWSKKAAAFRSNPRFGEIIVNRVGWQQISRRKRKNSRIIQSWQLLPVAEEMIRNVTYCRQIYTKRKWRYNEKLNSITFKEYYYLKSRVKFNHRSETIVYVILRKIVEKDCSTLGTMNSKTWFYSVYEGGRGVKKVGNHISK